MSNSLISKDEEVEDQSDDITSIQQEINNEELAKD